MAQQSNYWGKHDSKDHVVFGTSLVVQWLRLHTRSAGGQGLIPGQGTRSHVPQVRPGTAKEISKFCLFFWKKDHVFFRLEQGSRDSFVSYKHGSPMDFLLKEAAFQQEKKSNSYPETFFFSIREVLRNYSAISRCLEKEMTIHSRILAWRIPWTEEPGSYSPWGYGVGHNWAFWMLWVSQSFWIDP